MAALWIVGCHKSPVLARLIPPPLIRADNDALPGDERIKRLVVVVDTADVPDAAGTDAVYFDIGPLQWQLSASGSWTFTRHSRLAFELALPSSLDVRARDVRWLRLHKKGGIGTWTGTPDGLGGAWRPSRVTLIINDAHFISFAVDRWLERGHPWWARTGGKTSPMDELQRVLRLERNRPIDRASELWGALTTPFKKLGISGWKPIGLPRTCVTGIVDRTPARSTDGLATIDVRVTAISMAGGPSKQLSDSRPRFLRIEYPYWPERFFGDGPSDRYPVPDSGRRMTFCGAVAWDSDDEGWFELHPAGPADATFLTTDDKTSNPR